MPEMIPEHLPDHASQGERAVFAALQQLGEDVLVFYEPIVRRRYPDFIVVYPALGVFVIEVKGWRASWLETVTETEIAYRQAGALRVDRHPFRQARDYMNRLMQECERHPLAAQLLSGGRFKFTFSSIAILSGATRAELVEKNVDAYFARSRCVAADEWQTIKNAGAVAIESMFRAAQDPELRHASIDGAAITALRSVIHPETTIPSHRVSEPALSLKLLDFHQERLARDMRSGHRVVYGVAGSGKTVILLARARILAEANRAEGKPSKSILVLCYNKGLAEYLASALSGCIGVKVSTFGDWARAQGAPKNYNEEEFGNGLLNLISSGEGESGQYDAVLIDEGQDFVGSWFKCAVGALKDRESSDLLVLYDVSQNLYGRPPISWEPLGIRIRGGSGGSRTDRLDVNYRNTREIVSTARAFSSALGVDGDAGINLDPEKCLRRGPWPIIANRPTQGQLVEHCANLIAELAEDGVIADGQRIYAKPDEVRVLYPRDEGGLKAAIVNELARRHLPTGIVSTIHSSKGLQAKVVIVVRADLLPSHFPDRNEQAERALLYVALTRPEDLLIVLHCHETPYVRALINGIEAQRLADGEENAEMNH